MSGQVAGSLGADDRSSKVSIVNAALALITNELIDVLPTAADQGGLQIERDLARLFPDAYDETLADAPWPSATVREMLTSNDSDQPDYAAPMGIRLYRVPESCVRLVTIFNTDGDDVQFRKQGQFIEASQYAGTLIASFVKSVDPQELMTAPLLRSAIAARLAWRFTVFKTQSVRHQQRMYGVYEEEKAKAYRADTAQSSARIPRRSRVLEVMNGQDSRQPRLGVEE